jgi:hypothetical protein
MSHPARIAAVPIVLVSLLVTVSAAGVIPGAEDPKAFTEHDLLRARLEFNKRTLAGAYASVGARDPKWDDAAGKFLDAMAAYFTYSSAARVYRDVRVPSAAECKPLGQAAADAGCNDPLVTYCRAALLLNLGDRAGAAPMIAQSLRGLVERKYPPNRIIAAVGRIREVAPGETRFEPLAWKCAMDVADAGPADELRQKAITLAAVFDALTPPRQLDFCKALSERTTADPWLVNLFRGRYEIQAAWGDRGNGVAATVTGDGWKGFAEHATKARDHLVKAHDLHPEFPEAAAELITVAMAGGERLNITPRAWFEKAVRAQIDYAPAYDKYVYAMYPRWGGSHVDMYRFGIECLETLRFDTGVPQRMWDIVKSIDEDSTRDFDVLKVPEVQVALWQLFTTMSDKSGA